VTAGAVFFLSLQLVKFTEVESGKKDDRPELSKALQACRVYGAKLVIAKLDRLSEAAVSFYTATRQHRTSCLRIRSEYPAYDISQ
jgi:DNA invertase Pin-like site-specific DNA recombinase